MLSHFADGGYRFIPSPGRPFSAGIVTDTGFDLVHAVFLRPAAALAAFELRIPEPLSREGFDAFNEPYVERMAALGLRGEEGWVTARTNVAPTVTPVGEPSLYAFTYTVPGGNRPQPAFRLSGATETRRDGTAADRLGSIVEVLSERMAELGVSWEAATTINVYGATVAPADEVAAAFGSATLHGMTWFPSQPPLRDFEFEIDAHGVGTEIVL